MDQHKDIQKMYVTKKIQKDGNCPASCELFG